MTKYIHMSYQNLFTSDIFNMIRPLSSKRYTIIFCHKRRIYIHEYIIRYAILCNITISCTYRLCVAHSS